MGFNLPLYDEEHPPTVLGILAPAVGFLTAMMIEYHSGYFVRTDTASVQHEAPPAPPITTTTTSPGAAVTIYVTGNASIAAPISTVVSTQPPSTPPAPKAEKELRTDGAYYGYDDSVPGTRVFLLIRFIDDHRYGWYTSSHSSDSRRSGESSKPGLHWTAEYERRGDTLILHSVKSKDGDRRHEGRWEAVIIDRDTIEWRRFQAGDEPWHELIHQRSIFTNAYSEEELKRMTDPWKFSDGA